MDTSQIERMTEKMLLDLGGDGIVRFLRDLPTALWDQGQRLNALSQAARSQLMDDMGWQHVCFVGHLPDRFERADLDDVDATYDELEALTQYPPFLAQMLVQCVASMHSGDILYAGAEAALTQLEQGKTPEETYYHVRDVLLALTVKTPHPPDSPEWLDLGGGPGGKVVSAIGGIRTYRIYTWWNIMVKARLPQRIIEDLNYDEKLLAALARVPANLRALLLPHAHRTVRGVIETLALQCEGALRRKVPMRKVQQLIQGGLRAVQSPSLLERQKFLRDRALAAHQPPRAEPGDDAPPPIP